MATQLLQVDLLASAETYDRGCDLATKGGDLQDKYFTPQNTLTVSISFKPSECPRSEIGVLLVSDLFCLPSEILRTSARARFSTVSVDVVAHMGGVEVSMLNLTEAAGVLIRLTNEGQISWSGFYGADRLMSRLSLESVCRPERLSVASRKATAVARFPIGTGALVEDKEVNRFAQVLRRVSAK